MAQGQSAEIGDVHVTESYGERFASEASAVTILAGACDDEASDFGFGQQLVWFFSLGGEGEVSLLEHALEADDDPFIGLVLAAPSALLLRRGGGQLLLLLLGRTMQDRFLHGRIELAESGIWIDSQQLDRALCLVGQRHRTAAAPGEHRSLTERTIGIGHHAPGIDPHAQP